MPNAIPDRRRLMSMFLSRPPSTKPWIIAAITLVNGGMTDESIRSNSDRNCHASRNSRIAP